MVAGFVAQSSSDPFWGSWAEWKDAADRGFEIANHSMFHRDAKNLHGDDFDVSIDQAKEMIENKVNHKVTSFVFPHDSYTDEAVSRALREHEVIRASEFLRSFYNRTVGIVLGGPHVSVETANRLIDIGIKRHLWLVAKCHGVTPKRSMRSFKSITPQFLETHLAYIHSESDVVWVDTFSNIFKYLSQRKHAKIETKLLTTESIDFVLQNNGTPSKLSVPLTVVIKLEAGSHLKSAQGAGNRALKAWSCALDELCVNVDSYDENIHVQ